MGAILNWALRNGLRKGVVEGRSGWLVVAAAAGLWRLARRPPKQNIARFKLNPGERYAITCSDERIPG